MVPRTLRPSSVKAEDGRFLSLRRGRGPYLYVLCKGAVFYEREKMVALMFGFEAFECPGGVARAGEFGYYLRKVEL